MSNIARTEIHNQACYQQLLPRDRQVLDNFTSECAASDGDRFDVSTEDRARFEATANAGLLTATMLPRIFLSETLAHQQAEVTQTQGALRSGDVTALLTTSASTFRALTSDQQARFTRLVLRHPDTAAVTAIWQRVIVPILVRLPADFSAQRAAAYSGDRRVGLLPALASGPAKRSNVRSMPSQPK